jgi:hypothetical protein
MIPFNVIILKQDNAIRVSVSIGASALSETKHLNNFTKSSLYNNLG